MTNAELRELLAKFPEEMTVKLRDSDDRLYDVDRVDICAMRSMSLWERLTNHPNAEGDPVVVIA